MTDPGFETLGYGKYRSTPLKDLYETSQGRDYLVWLIYGKDNQSHPLYDHTLDLYQRYQTWRDERQAPDTEIIWFGKDEGKPWSTVTRDPYYKQWYMNSKLADNKWYEEVQRLFARDDKWRKEHPTAYPVHSSMTLWDMIDSYGGYDEYDYGYGYDYEYEDMEGGEEEEEEKDDDDDEEEEEEEEHSENENQYDDNETKLMQEEWNIKPELPDATFIPNPETTPTPRLTRSSAKTLHSQTPILMPKIEEDEPTLCSVQSSRKRKAGPENRPIPKSNTLSSSYTVVKEEPETSSNLPRPKRTRLQTHQAAFQVKSDENTTTNVHPTPVEKCQGSSSSRKTSTSVSRRRRKESAPTATKRGQDRQANVKTRMKRT